MGGANSVVFPYIFLCQARAVGDKSCILKLPALSPRSRLIIITFLTQIVCFSLGYGCPANYNPSDHYIYTLAVIPNKEIESKERLKTICDTFKNSDVGRKMAPLDSSAVKVFGRGMFKADSSSYKAGLFQQARWVFWRSLLTIKRDKLLMRVRIMQTVVSTF